MALPKKYFSWLPAKRNVEIKLSATINFFDGEELLEHCIRCIRPSVEHISIVWQSVSNFGHPISAEAMDALARIRRSGDVDVLEHYEPDLTQPPHMNELEKRRIGFRLAREANMTHGLLMDADEFYAPEEMAWARDYIAQHGIDYSTVSLYRYVQEPIYRSAMPMATVCSFITRLTSRLVHEYRIDIHPEENIDATRAPIVPRGRYHFFPPERIAMHHMTGLRRNFSSKVTNSTRNEDPLQSVKLRREVSLIQEWMPENSLVIGDEKRLQMIVVPDRFGLIGWREGGAESS